MPWLPHDIYVACFASVRRWGGGVTAATGLAAACRERGWSTLLLGVSGRTAGAAAGPAADSPASDPPRLDVGLPAVPLLWRVPSWYTAERLARRLRRLPPPHKALVTISPYWVLAAKHAWPRTPVIYRHPCLLTNCLPFTWPGRTPPTLWGRINHRGIRRAERHAYDLADLTLVPTPAARDEVLAFHPAAAARVAVCNYGYQPQEITAQMRHQLRQALGLGDGDWLLLALGVCDRNKSFDCAIRELPAMSPCVHLVIAGDGPQLPHLERTAAQHGVGARVRLVGVQRHVAPWYAAADSVVSTSLYDSFPNVVMEAMYHGRPVIVPRHRPPEVFSGTASVVEEIGGGLTYERLEQRALAAAVNALVNGRDAAVEMGRRGSAAVRARFQRRCIVDRIAAFLGEPPARPDAEVCGPRRQIAAPAGRY